MEELMASVNAGPTEAQAEAGAMAALGRNWWLLLFFGVISIIVGIFCVMQPVDAVETLAWLFAIWLIVTGIFEIIRSFSSGIGGGMRALLIITGALSLILGFVALRSFWDDDVVLAGWILAIFIGISFLFRGFSVLFMGIEGKGQPGRGWNIFAGIVIIIGGMIILTAPASIIALAWVVGIWLIVMGIFEIISSFMVRKAVSA
ncbi:MAG: HdeD family acid-resistance protein [Actinobacteria bacterium]|nr:HdeD family acid-resistance protein [Actinomycetota bacterium]